MADKESAGPPSGNTTPQDLADPSKHQHGRLFEGDHPARGVGAGETAHDRFEGGEDMLSANEPTVGESIGPDTTGAVAPPAGGNRAGASTKLGGTPSALSVSGGRDAN